MDGGRTTGRAIAAALGMLCAVPPPAAARTVADPAFSAPFAGQVVDTAVLRAFLAQLKQAHRPQRFCFVVETFPPSAAEQRDSLLLRMVWTTGERIYSLALPDPATPAHSDMPAEWRGQALAWSKPVDLRTGVVATQEEVGASTYLVTRAWADRILAQCRRIGRTVTLAPSRPAR